MSAATFFSFLHTRFLRKFKLFLDRWPGKKYLGMYRFLPIFFILGAALEFSMINWQVGETNFYNTYKKRQARNQLEELIHKEQI